MAIGKKSFVAYADWKEVFDELPDNEAGKLIKHIFAYVNDENPISDSILIRAVFANIKTTLKRDLDKWESQLEQRREAGKKSAELRATKSNERSTSVESRERNPTDNVSVNVNVSDNGIVNDKIIINDNLENVQIVKNENFIKFENWILENAPQVAKMKEPFTEAQFLKLGNDFSRELIIETISAMHNKKDLLKKYNSANLTLRSWINLKNQKNEQSTSIGRTAKPNTTDAYDKFGETLRGLANVD